MPFTVPSHTVSGQCWTLGFMLLPTLKLEKQWLPLPFWLISHNSVLSHESAAPGAAVKALPPSRCDSLLRGGIARHIRPLSYVLPLCGAQTFLPTLLCCRLLDNGNQSVTKKAASLVSSECEDPPRLRPSISFFTFSAHIKWVCPTAGSKV